ncbi:MAG: aspartate aminotransferase family protein [Methanobacteriota archaeon]|nr:MAG: aspartate aminotransferase family protein [Euryarchaeota archaeon]
MTKEIDADPDDWEELRQSLHKSVDDMVNWLKSIRERKPWQPIPEPVKNHFTYEWGDNGRNLNDIYDEFIEFVLPYPSGNIHPRYWGWVNGTGIAHDLIVELLIATMNSNVGGREHIANYVERQVLNWYKSLFGFPENSSGVLTTGCSVANLIGLTVARTAKLGEKIRELGQAKMIQPIYYGSNQVHSSIYKALEIIGVGRNHFRAIKTNKDYSIDTAALEEQLQIDLQQGLTPICLIGNVGTVNTGAVDDIAELGRIAKKYGLWLHLDAAFGAALKLTRLNHLVKHLDLADSIAFDLHKWFYIQYEIGCILVKDEKFHRKALSLRPDYLAEQKRGAGSGGRWFTEYGLQLSRNFKALKPWFLLQLIGKRKYSELLNKNLDQAQYLTSLIEQSDHLQLMSPTITNVVCFRFYKQGLTENSLEDLNQEILHLLHEEGVAVPSSTRLKGIFTLRVAIVNHRSRKDDFNLLVDEVERIGLNLLEKGLFR